MKTLTFGLNAAALACILGIGALAQDPVGGAPPQRDPALALAQEYRRALADDTNYALLEFILRHPAEPLAVTARSRLAARPAPETARSSGPEADIYAAFDAARAAGGRAAMTALAARYANHPIAAEARQPIWSR